MLRLLADENFNGRILRALLREIPDLDVLRAQDCLTPGSSDVALLEFAADMGCVVLTHDVATLVGYAYERVTSLRPMPGVVAAHADAPIGQVVEDLLILLRAGTAEDVVSRVLFVPW